MIPMISSDRAFEQAANAFAAFTAPAYVQYTERLLIESKTMRMSSDATYTVYRRSIDDAVSIPLSKRTYRSNKHMLSPMFDVLSDFGLRGSLDSGGNFNLWSENVAPLHYDLAPRPGIDSVTIAIQKYHTRYVDDQGPASYHIHLDSANGETNILPRLFFKEIIIDAKSGLPTRVELVGPDERDFDVHYDISSGRPVIESFLFGQTFSMGLGLVRARATLHAWYTGVMGVAQLDDAVFSTPAPLPSPSPR